MRTNALTYTLILKHGSFGTGWKYFWFSRLYGYYWNLGGRG